MGIHGWMRMGLFKKGAGRLDRGFSWTGAGRARAGAAAPIETIFAKTCKC